MLDERPILSYQGKILEKYFGGRDTGRHCKDCKEVFNEKWNNSFFLLLAVFISSIPRSDLGFVDT